MSDDNENCDRKDTRMVTSKKAQAEGTTEMSTSGPFTPGYIQIWMDILAENARFMTDRLREDMETQKAILACKTPEELMRVQSKFFHEAVSQYTQHGKHLSEKLASATADLKPKQSRGYDDVPL